MTNYYNENDPFAAQWLRNLISANLIPPGHVDDRSIQDVIPSDLAGFTQCHFFAGIAGWSRALELASWPADRPVWTGSCPCQPFSLASRRTGIADARHLWPVWWQLIRECRPGIVFGEQIANGPGLGWWDLVANDLEMAGYACAAMDLCAAGIKAPHLRQRLYWVAYGGAGLEEQRQQQARIECPALERSDALGLLADRESERWQLRFGTENRCRSGFSNDGELDFWSSCDWLPCRDGKSRPVEPGTFPLAHGVSRRVGQLRAYGNAIVPQVAAEFIMAFQNFGVGSCRTKLAE